MTTEPKPLDLPPMPEYHDEPAATNQDAEWRHIHDLKKWGRQLAGIAQAQAALADGLAEALERISLMSCRCIDDGKPCPGCTKSGREAPVVAYQALAKYRENR